MDIDIDVTNVTNHPFDWELVSAIISQADNLNHKHASTTRMPFSSNRGLSQQRPSS